MYVCMYVCIYVCMYVCVCVRMCVCACTGVYYIRVFGFKPLQLKDSIPIAKEFTKRNDRNVKMLEIVRRQSVLADNGRNNIDMIQFT
jgi:hypothetical protein